MGRKKVGGTPATVALARAGVGFTLHPYEHDPRAASRSLRRAPIAPADLVRVLEATTGQIGRR